MRQWQFDLIRGGIAGAVVAASTAFGGAPLIVSGSLIPAFALLGVALAPVGRAIVRPRPTHDDD